MYNKKISELQGIGKFYAACLMKAGISRASGLLWLFPRNIINIKAGGVRVGKNICMNIVVKSCTNGKIVKLIAQVGSEELSIIFFKFIKVFYPTSKLCVLGDVTIENGQYQMKSPKWKYGHHDMFSEFDYKVDKVPNAILQKVINEIIKTLPDDEDIAFMDQYDLYGLKHALTMIHSGQGTKACMRSVGLAELIAYRRGMVQAKESMLSCAPGCQIHKVDISECIKHSGFELTEDQKIAWNEIINDLESEISMTRMLYGDVGSGKTIVAILALYTVYKNGKQAALLAPTQILANQHYETCKALLQDVNLILLTRHTRTKAVQYTIANEPCIIIGTHALLQDTNPYKDLALLIIDEHHRFGVLQRIALMKNAGLRYNLLIMSATPIPRTLKLLTMNNIATSKLLTRPQAHRNIAVKAVYSKNIDSIYERIREHLKQNGNIFWVCPFIEPSETKEGMDVYTRSAELRAEFGHDAVVILHARMKTKDKTDVFAEFKNTFGKILVATTVIEVGVNVVHANLMIVENSELFGLAQLYQLLGRVGRGSKAGECYLLYDKANANTKLRLNALQTKTSGIEIAEADIMIRGYGNILGIEQNGHFSNIFKVFDPDTDDFLYEIAEEYIATQEFKHDELFEKINDPWGGG